MLCPKIRKWGFRYWIREYTPNKNLQSTLEAAVTFSVFLFLTETVMLGLFHVRTPRPPRRHPISLSLTAPPGSHTLTLSHTCTYVSPNRALRISLPLPLFISIMYTARQPHLPRSILFEPPSPIPAPPHLSLSVDAFLFLSISVSIYHLSFGRLFVQLPAI